MRSLRTWLLLPLLFLAMSYVSAGNGEALVSDSMIHAYLESLSLTPGMTKAKVIEQLGPPSYAYEKDNVMSYAVYEQEGRLFTGHPGIATDVTIQLMLKFSGAWRLERVALIPTPYRFFGGRPGIEWL